MPENPNGADNARVVIDFIDPLFATVISISFVEVMERPWFTPASANVQASFASNIAVLLLGYFTVILSWLGYHLSISRNRIRIGTLAGQLRFGMDIILVAGYGLLLVKFENLWFVLLMLAVTYFLFMIWDHLKWWEYRADDSKGSWRRRGVTTFWFIIFTALFLPYWLLGLEDDSLNVFDWLFLGLAYLFTLSYRIHKDHLWFGTLLDKLAYHRPQKSVCT